MNVLSLHKKICWGLVFSSRTYKKYPVLYSVSHRWRIWLISNRVYLPWLWSFLSILSTLNCSSRINHFNRQSFMYVGFSHALTSTICSKLIRCTRFIVRRMKYTFVRWRENFSSSRSNSVKMIYGQETRAIGWETSIRLFEKIKFNSANFACAPKHHWFNR